MPILFLYFSVSVPSPNTKARCSDKTRKFVSHFCTIPGYISFANLFPQCNQAMRDYCQSFSSGTENRNEATNIKNQLGSKKLTGKRFNLQQFDDSVLRL
jgi:predicted lipoprotein